LCLLSGGNVGVVGATESTGTKPSEVLTSDSESGSEVDSNSPTLEMQVIKLEESYKLN